MKDTARLLETSDFFLIRRPGISHERRCCHSFCNTVHLQPATMDIQLLAAEEDEAAVDKLHRNVDVFSAPVDLPSR